MKCSTELKPSTSPEETQGKNEDWYDENLQHVVFDWFLIFFVSSQNSCRVLRRGTLSLRFIIIVSIGRAAPGPPAVPGGDRTTVAAAHSTCDSESVDYHWVMTSPVIPLGHGYTNQAPRLAAVLTVNLPVKLGNWNSKQSNPTEGIDSESESESGWALHWRPNVTIACSGGPGRRRAPRRRGRLGHAAGHKLNLQAAGSNLNPATVTVTVTANIRVNTREA